MGHFDCNSRAAGVKRVGRAETIPCGSGVGRDIRVTRSCWRGNCKRRAAMPYGGNDWLALTQEPTLEPEIPICDPHHLPATTQRWRRSASGWPAGSLARLCRHGDERAAAGAAALIGARRSPAAARFVPDSPLEGNGAASACCATPLSPRADHGGKHEGHPAAPPGDPISDRNATKSLSSIDCRNPPLFQSHDAEAGGEALFGMGRRSS